MKPDDDDNFCNYNEALAFLNRSLQVYQNTATKTEKKDRITNVALKIIDCCEFWSDQSH